MHFYTYQVLMLLSFFYYIWEKDTFKLTSHDLLHYKVIFFLYDQTFLSHQTTESVFPVSCYLQSIQIGRGRYNFVSLKYSINRIIIIVIIVVLETKSNFDTIIKIGQFCNIIFAIRWEVKGLWMTKKCKNKCDI